MFVYNFIGVFVNDLLKYKAVILYSPHNIWREGKKGKKRAVGRYRDR